MHIIGTLIIGFIVGLVARFFMPGKDKLGLILTTVLGIAGAWFGTWLGSAIGLYAFGEPAGFIMSVIGAMLILLIYRKVSNKG